MHLIKGGWVGVGQTFAIATSNDSEGRKSRIRRSKEERKSMAESFIKKYQDSNNGSFPSLNLTHKEVGGSFYTVREIVRDIIQENRVLAPPKVPLEERDHYGCLKHPLGSISMEPQMDVSVSDRIHIVTHKVPDQYGITSEEHISSSCMQILGPEPLELNSVNGLDKMTTDDKRFGRASVTVPNHHQNTSTEEISDASELLPQPNTHEFENKNIGNGGKVLEENPDSDKPVITNTATIHHQDNSNKNAPLPNQNLDGLGSHRLSDEQNVTRKNQMVEKTKELRQQIYTESIVIEILDREKDEAKDIDASQIVASHKNSNIVVETFPLRSVSGTIHMHEESGKLHEAAGTFEDKTIQHDMLTIVQSISGSISEKDDIKLSESTLELDGEFRDEKVALNLEDPSVENSKFSTTSKSTELDEGDVKDFEFKGSFPRENKTSSATESLMSKDTPAVRRNSSDQDMSTLPKGINPMLDRINLETWEGESKKSTHTESNPLLALFKAFISAFVKFWSE